MTYPIISPAMVQSKSWDITVTSVLTEQRARATAKPMRLGVVAWVRKGETPDAVIARVKKLGFPTCQIGFHGLTRDSAGPLKRALQRHQIEATALLELGPGRMVWDFYEGPLTVGLVPKATRRARSHEAGGRRRRRVRHPRRPYPLRIRPDEPE